MSPGGRRGRSHATADESHLRDLSPNTTLRAFTQKPMPFDTNRDEYKIFACIETLTAAERDLGARVAKAAQRLKSWCDEIEQWPWSGSFSPPGDAYRERRRRSLELRIKEHVKDADVADKLPPLEYWGSLLSVEVEAHEARLDDISDELIALDIEELKGHVMDMHPASKSRPSSAGYGADRQGYKPLDDFNFLITQTLLSALPHHYQLKERLSTWTARVTILREAPRFLDDLKTAQNAMNLGWEALDPPSDASDAAFHKWKSTVDTISGVMRERVGDLGRRLDTMLDTLEGREDCLPDDWIDVFEGVEANFGRWTHESRRKMIDFDIRRTTGQSKGRQDASVPEQRDPHSDVFVETQERDVLPPKADSTPSVSVAANSEATRSVAPLRLDVPTDPQNPKDATVDEPNPQPEDEIDDSVFEEGDTVVHNEIDESPVDVEFARSESIAWSESPVIVTTEVLDAPMDRPETPRSRRASVESISSDLSFSSSPVSIEQSPSVRNPTNHPLKAPRLALNAAMTKRRPAKQVKELSVDSAPPWPPTQFADKSPTSADDLERKISDILTTIPAHIRLTSSTGADARNLKFPRGVTNKGSKGYLRAARTPSGMKSPELTLSPVKQDSDSANALSGRKSAATMRSDNGIKLYHLSQPGKEHPIKLYIRRVGENGERVMVRVGGGWADLGEYLRQYAEHHGRRTASHEGFEILGLGLNTTEVPPIRSESAMSKRDRRVSGGEHIGSPHSTPAKTAGIGISKDESPPPMPKFTPTPTSSDETSAPSTTSSRHSWQGNEVGLAGPNTKKLDLSNQKLEWIEGMMKQARTVSGNMSQGSQPQPERTESRSESRTASRKPQADFGDLGKVGGTKRIFLRGGALSEH